MGFILNELSHSGSRDRERGYVLYWQHVILSELSHGGSRDRELCWRINFFADDKMTQQPRMPMEQVNHIRICIAVHYCIFRIPSVPTKYPFTHLFICENTVFWCWFFSLIVIFTFLGHDQERTSKASFILLQVFFFFLFFFCYYFPC